MASTWEEEVHLCVCGMCDVFRGVCLVSTGGGVWGGSVTPGAGPLGECLRAKPATEVGENSLGVVTPGETLGTLYTFGVSFNKTKQH